MFNDKPPIVQQVNQGIINQYNELQEIYSQLKSDAEELYNAVLTDEEYKDKLYYDVDDISVNKDFKEIYGQYEYDKDKLIKNLLSKKYNYNEEKIEKIFNVRKRLLNNQRNSLSLDKIGTVLNVIREFHHDIYTDIERNKLKWQKKSESTPTIKSISMKNPSNDRSAEKMDDVIFCYDHMKCS